MHVCSLFWRFTKRMISNGWRQPRAWVHIRLATNCMYVETENLETATKKYLNKYKYNSICESEAAKLIIYQSKRGRVDLILRLHYHP
jgi:hypothetical protein